MPVNTEEHRVRKKRYKARAVGGKVAEDLFDRGLCLPSGTAMTEADLDRICTITRSCHRRSGSKIRKNKAIEPPVLASRSAGLRSLRQAQDKQDAKGAKEGLCRLYDFLSYAGTFFLFRHGQGKLNPRRRICSELKAGQARRYASRVMVQYVGLI